MYRDYLEVIYCPSCEGDLKIQTGGAELKEHVEEGILFCERGHWFPVKGFIPRLLLGEFRTFERDRWNEYLEQMDVKPSDMGRGGTDPDQKQVKESFGEKWLTVQDWGHKGASRDVFREWALDKYGWNNERQLKGFLDGKQWMLDAGCGTGRELVYHLELAPHLQAVGIDISQSIEVAGDRLLPSSNCLLVQGDLMNLPLESKKFDFIHSEGVLHHTPSTERAFKRVAEDLTDEGDFQFYVYRKKAPLREHVDNTIREQTSQLSFEECWEFSEKITKLGKQLHEQGGEISIGEEIPFFEFPSEETSIQRFIYNHIFKCYWNEEASFEENCSVNFDWYSPKYAHRQSADELEQWITEAGLSIRHWHQEYSGFSVRVGPD